MGTQQYWRPANLTSTGTVRVRLRYTDLDTFIERFAPNVTRGGVFLASRTPRAEGEVFRFEVQLASGAVALAGEGKVIWVKPYDPAEPQKPHGMGVQFVQIDPASRDTLNHILRIKGVARVPGARTTQPHATLHGTGTASNGGRPRIDTNVDLAAEHGIDDAVLRRVIDRNWTLGPRSDENIEDLLKPDPVEPATLAQALAELPRLLEPTSRHRSGPRRSLELPPVATPARATYPTDHPATSNGDPDETTLTDSVILTHNGGPH